ncbi:MAG TPA: hypothetical protein VFX30_00250 [bacterium]|nr:hypothetical protein [bacterium]
MKKFILTLLLAFPVPLATSCGGGTSSWTDQPYDVAAEATLTAVLQDISALSGISFSVEPGLQARFDRNPVDLPTLTGLTAGDVLTLIQDVMPPETEFLFEEKTDGSVVLITRFEEKEDLAGTDPLTLVDYDSGLGAGVAALNSEPAFEEICGGEVENVLGLLGSGGVFDIATEVESDDGGHAEFIGDFPPSVEMEIDGHDVFINGEAPWVGVSGTIEDDGSFTCTGSGTVAGFPDVQVDFLGQASPDGLSGTLTVGADGALPGGTSVVYLVHP